MKKVYTFLSLLLLAGLFTQVSAQRYLTEVFTDYDLTAHIEYAQNITVITGSPAPDTMHFDFYEPKGDTMAERPLLLVSHTGSFLPSPQNGQATGSEKDTAVVDFCRMMAKRGFAVAAYTYRKGWNPVGSQEERTGTLLNAAYRGIQDTRTIVRFFRSDYESGNNYGIDTGKIAVGGFGTGGYLAFGSATLDDYAEINLAKFLNPGNGQSYVDTSLSGDFDGTWARPLNQPNHVGYSSKFHMAFNMGGAIGDSTWLEPGDVPMVGFHCPNDPFAPYGYGPVIVPTTGDFVVNVSGTHDVIRRANLQGNQGVINTAIYNDAYTTANVNNNGWDGLYPFLRPTPESGPWEYWDSTYWKQVPHPTQGNFHNAGLQTNPDMSRAKSMAYLDTIVNYLSPRMVCVLGLPGCVLTDMEDEVANAALSLYPNPAHSRFTVSVSGQATPIQRVEILDLMGRKVKTVTGLNTREIDIDRDGLKAGVYIVQVQLEKGTASRRLILE